MQAKASRWCFHVVFLLSETPQNCIAYTEFKDWLIQKNYLHNMNESNQPYTSFIVSLYMYWYAVHDYDMHWYSFVDFLTYYHTFLFCHPITCFLEIPKTQCSFPLTISKQTAVGSFFFPWIHVAVCLLATSLLPVTSFNNSCPYFHWMGEELNASVDTTALGISFFVCLFHLYH